jgi:5-formyltetrahydrofolate cyclo-ligase
MDKQILRKIMRERLKTQKEVSRRKRSTAIKGRLFRLSEFKKAKTLMLYASFQGEVDTKSMIEGALKKGKQVALPFISKGTKRLIPRAITAQATLEKGPYGIMQPKKYCSRLIAKHNLDLVVVPGLAFDSSGVRLGRGKGYYDRFLASLPKKTHTVGVCFDFQLVSSVPHSPSDLPVQKLISA